MPPIDGRPLSIFGSNTTPKNCPLSSMFTNSTKTITIAVQIPKLCILKYWKHHNCQTHKFILEYLLLCLRCKTNSHAWWWNSVSTHSNTTKIVKGKISHESLWVDSQRFVGDFSLDNLGGVSKHLVWRKHWLPVTIYHYHSSGLRSDSTPPARSTFFTGFDTVNMCTLWELCFVMVEQYCGIRILYSVTGWHG